MNDCPNVTMREMLPELLNDRLEADARAQVQSHADACADCRAELELLRTVRASAPAPRVDAARISAGIAPYHRRSAWASAARSWPLRVAAAVILVAGTATIMRQGSASLGQPDTVLAAAASPALSVGALADIPDQDLRALMTELGRIQAVTSSEPDVVVPAVGGSSGGGQ
ncbi:MAG: zf-HC2 domain-containing protein [Gemmatimonadota bacterium]